VIAHFDDLLVFDQNDLVLRDLPRRRINQIAGAQGDGLRVENAAKPATES
jgi:hypothetical protein